MLKFLGMSKYLLAISLKTSPFDLFFFLAFNIKTQVLKKWYFLLCCCVRRLCERQVWEQQVAPLSQINETILIYTTAASQALFKRASLRFQSVINW